MVCTSSYILNHFPPISRSEIPWFMNCANTVGRCVLLLKEVSVQAELNVYKYPPPKIFSGSISVKVNLNCLEDSVHKKLKEKKVS